MTLGEYAHFTDTETQFHSEKWTRSWSKSVKKLPFVFSPVYFQTQDSLKELFWTRLNLFTFASSEPSLVSGTGYLKEPSSCFKALPVLPKAELITKGR